MLIKPILIAAIETALNRYLALDDNRQILLHGLAGKVVAIKVLPFDEIIYLCPSADCIQVIDQLPVGEPDTIISGSLWALGLMGVSGKPMRSVFAGDISIEGDIQCGKQFQDLFKKLDIDLEAVLARFTGDQVAQGISQFFRASFDWGKDTVETFRLNAAEFIQEETRDVPAKVELDLFYQEVDDLISDFDRLEKRVERLENLPTKPSTQQE